MAAGLATTNGPWAQGEGLAIAQAAGAQLIHMDHVQIHPTGFVDPKVRDLGPLGCPSFPPSPSFLAFLLLSLPLLAHRGQHQFPLRSRSWCIRLIISSSAAAAAAAPCCCTGPRGGNQVARPREAARRGGAAAQRGGPALCGRAVHEGRGLGGHAEVRSWGVILRWGGLGDVAGLLGGAGFGFGRGSRVMTREIVSGASQE